MPINGSVAGVSVNYHMLADFRSQGGARNGTRLLTQIVATLMAEGLVTMDRVAGRHAGAGRRGEFTALQVV